MSLLNNVISGPTPGAPKGIICGSPGAGKTTFGASAPGAILLDIENGANAVTCARTPYLETWPEIEKWLKELLNGQHDYRVVVIDTIDWLMRRMEEHVSGAMINREQTLNKSHQGYGNGAQVLTNYVYLNLFPVLDRIIQKGIAVIMLAHATRREFTDAEGVTIEKTVPALPKNFLDIFVEWSDFVGTIRFDKNGGRQLALTSDNVVLAKNRYSLPAAIPFAWDSFAGAIKNYHAQNKKKENKKIDMKPATEKDN